MCMFNSQAITFLHVSPVLQEGAETEISSSAESKDDCDQEHDLLEAVFTPELLETRYERSCVIQDVHLAD